MEAPKDAEPGPVSPRLRITLWTTSALLGVLIVLAATGYQFPDARTTAKATAAALLGVLVVLASLVLVVVAALRRSAILVTIGVLVLLSGVGILSTTFGLPAEMQETTNAVTALLDLLNELLRLLGRLLKLLTGGA